MRRRHLLRSLACLPALPSLAQSAFAYPATHLQGQPLKAEFLRGLEVDAIARLHDRLAPRGATFAGSDPALRSPLPIVDLIFSQPLRRV